MIKAWVVLWVWGWGTAAAQWPEELTRAMENGDVQTLKTIVETQNPDRSARRESDRTTALHWAARTGNARAVEILVRAGWDVNAESAWGTPAHALFLAPKAQRCPEEALEILLSAGADWRAKTEQHGTLLHRAVFENCPATAKMLIERGADINAKATYLQQTPLHTALREAKGDRDAMIRLLLDHKADVNALNARGDTPLHYAVAFGETAHVQMLVDAGAKLDVPNKENKTPLALAKEQKETDKTKILQKAGAKK
jgi:ankyrin repeat protein